MTGRGVAWGNTLRNVAVIRAIARMLVESGFNGCGVLDDANQTLPYQLLEFALVGCGVGRVEVTVVAVHGLAWSVGWGVSNL